jgi:hypothetical protein
MVRGRTAIGAMWKSMAEQVSDPQVTTLKVKPLGSSAAREIGTFSLKTKVRRHRKLPVSMSCCGRRSEKTGSSQPISGIKASRHAYKCSRTLFYSDGDADLRVGHPTLRLQLAVLRDSEAFCRYSSRVLTTVSPSLSGEKALNHGGRLGLASFRSSVSFFRPIKMPAAQHQNRRE